MLLIRRVKGKSMEPYVYDGQILVALRRKSFQKGQYVIFQHEGRQKLKKVAKLRNNSDLYVVGSNDVYSTDSRDYGWISARAVMGVVIWPRLQA